MSTGRETRRMAEMRKEGEVAMKHDAGNAKKGMSALDPHPDFFRVKGNGRYRYFKKWQSP